MYLAHTPSWQHTLHQARTYFEELSAPVGGDDEFSNRVKGKNNASPIFSSRENELWVKMDGDRISRRITIDNQDTFETIFTKVLLKVNASGTKDNYCLVDSRDRLMDALSDILRCVSSECVRSVFGARMHLFHVKWKGQGIKKVILPFAFINWESDLMLKYFLRMN